jgi:uncharacterized protein YceH (UPF0502 family)
MVIELPRQPGSRENRWMHLLSGEPVIEDLPPVASAHETTGDVSISEMAVLKTRLTQLEAEVDTLKTMVGKLYAELGIAD